MFEIFGAIFGSIYLGGKYLKEKNAEWEYKERERAKLQAYADFERKYGDSALESMLRHDLYNPTKRDALWGEVSGILRQLDGWQYYSRADFDKQNRDINDKYFYESDQLAIDVLMTNRGKLSKNVMGQPWWYPHYSINHKASNDFKVQHRLARWIVTRINEYYPELSLYVGMGAYGWGDHNKPGHSALVQPYTQTWGDAYFDKSTANHDMIRSDVERELKIQFGLKSFLAVSMIAENADFELEASIKTELQDQTTQRAVWKRIEPILHGLESWNDYGEEDFINGLRSNGASTWGAENIALDILMAQYGKVPIRRLNIAHCEYPSIFDNSPEVHKKRTLELIAWLSDELQKNGSNLEIVCRKSTWMAFYVRGVGSDYGEVTPVHKLKR